MSAKKSSSDGYGWQNKSPAEKKRILATVKECGKNNCSWKRTAAMLGVHELTLIRWRKDDPEGKIDIAHEVGKAEAGEDVLGYMLDVAKDPDAQGRATVLVHLSKHLCNMGDKSTQTVVTPEDLAKPGDKGSRRSEALKILGLEALDKRQDQSGETS